MHISNKKPKGWVSIKEILSERYSPLILQKLNNFMATIISEIEVNCSECGSEIDVISKSTYAPAIVEPCDCMRNRIFELEKQVEKLENSLLNN